MGTCRITDGTLMVMVLAHFAGSVAQVGRFTSTKASFHCNEQDYDGADCHIVGSILVVYQQHVLNHKNDGICEDYDSETEYM